MKFKLSQILESTVLSEGRKEDAMNKYGASKELVDRLSAADPSGNNKYLMWMTGQVMGAGESEQIPLADAVTSAVERFHKQVNRFNKEMAEEAGISDKAKNNPKDINVYSDVNELLRITKVAEKKATDKQVKKEADKVYEDENIIVLAPLTVRASCKYGAGSRWCIAGGQAPRYNQHFDSYSKNAVFYFITDKTTTQRDNPTHYKYALQYNHKGGKTWWDASDSSHSTPPRFMTSPSGKKAMAAIDAYHMSAVGEKLQREIRKYMLQPTSRGYRDYRNHLTPEQRTEAVNKIIREEGATVQVFESLIEDLTEQQKDSLLHNLTGLTNSSFNKVKDQLNNTQLINVIKNNPVVLNNSESIKYIDGKLSDDEKYNLAHSMDKSKVSNTDSKVVIRKWSMTPEQRAQHSKYSQYVFLVDSNRGSIDDNGIIKVDSLNPESYKVINGLKLKATMDRSLSMYAIKTEADLLDQYTNKKGSEIDPDAIKGIMSKAKKI